MRLRSSPHAHIPLSSVDEQSPSRYAIADSVEGDSCTESALVERSFGGLQVTIFHTCYG
jgi:hypothetical protein